MHPPQRIPSSVDAIDMAVYMTNPTHRAHRVGQNEPYFRIRGPTGPPLSISRLASKSICVYWCGAALCNTVYPPQRIPSSVDTVSKALCILAVLKVLNPQSKLTHRRAVSVRRRAVLYLSVISEIRPGLLSKGRISCIALDLGQFLVRVLFFIGAVLFSWGACV